MRAAQTKGADVVNSTTTIQDIINRRVETSLADLLLTVYDAGYCAGANVSSAPPAHTGLADLLLLLEARHRAEILASRGWLPPPLLHDEIPGWLLAQCERQNALGDATPPAGREDRR
jgi:hypothetical protein